MVDVGCGTAHSIRLLCPPEEQDYVYVGLELSISALQTNRRTMVGDFIQCSGDQLPFRDSAVDAVVTLGTLHHLARAEQTVELALDCLRPGGVLGIHEVAARRNRARRSKLLQRGSSSESAHNESMDKSGEGKDPEASRGRGGKLWLLAQFGPFWSTFSRGR